MRDRQSAGRRRLLQRWRAGACRDPVRVVLADGDDPRAKTAARRLARDSVAIPLLLDGADTFRTPAVMAAARASVWRERIDTDDPLHIAALMVATGEADACVAGAGRPTPDVVRAALYCIGTAPDSDIVSSSFLLVLGDGAPVVYGDCGVVPQPDAAQLASIAIASAATYAQLTGADPRVAMLSYSTKASAQGPRVELVRAATGIVRRRAPALDVDGELQFDAAWVPEVAASKAPGSAVAGRANVFVFPDLTSGNIAYKITERLGGARAFGPLLQGTAGVVHDLSRGCSVDDIVTVATIAAYQAAPAPAAVSGTTHPTSGHGAPEAMTRQACS